MGIFFIHTFQNNSNFLIQILNNSKLFLPKFSPDTMSFLNLLEICFLGFGTVNAYQASKVAKPLSPAQRETIDKQIKAMYDKMKRHRDWLPRTQIDCITVTK